MALVAQGLTAFMQGFAEQGFAEQGFAEQGFAEQGFAEQGFAEQGFAEQGFAEQGFAEQGFAEQGFAEQGFSASAPFDQSNPPIMARVSRDSRMEYRWFMGVLLPMDAFERMLGFALSDLDIVTVVAMAVRFLHD